MSELSLGQIKGLPVNNNVVTVPSGNTLYAPGHVIQVINNNLTTSFYSAGTTLISTGLAATITPKSASSKVLIIVHQTADMASGRDIYTTLYRNSIDLAGVGNLFAGVYGSTSAIEGELGFTYMDSPATTSATTYTVYAKGHPTAWGIREWNRNITLMEIAQ